MSEEKNRIRITNDDLQSASVRQNVEGMKEAQKIALVRPIGNPDDLRKSSTGLMSILISSGAGLLGGFLAFLGTKLMLDVILVDSDDATVVNLTFTFILAFVIGLTVSIIDAATSRIGSKVAMAAAFAIPSSIVLGLAFGAIANAYYTSASRRIYEEAYLRLDRGESTETVEAFVRASNHFPRGLAWLFVGLAAGITVGIASKSLKRTGLTAAGGAVGGFLGGFVFDFMPQDLEWVAQAVGICITGLLIGSSMALLEQAARTQWIDIIEIIIGSSPQADITLIKDSAIAPRHARIFTQGGRTILESLNPGMPCTVDGTADMRFYLQDTNTITIGSTSIRFREKKSQKQIQSGVTRLS
jgi:hypothetical protein